tara:strand:- start:105 stop:332 length:228 start_codon:yes stop_codon:yes gene_type:complete
MQKQDTNMMKTKGLEKFNNRQKMDKKDYIYLGTIFVLVLALSIVSYKYNDQSTKQLNYCYQMFERFSDAIKQGSE